MLHANSKGTDQSAHLRRLISACYLLSRKNKSLTCYLLVSAFDCSQTLMAGFYAAMPVLVNTTEGNIISHVPYCTVRCVRTNKVPIGDNRYISKRLRPVLRFDYKQADLSFMILSRISPNALLLYL